MDRIGGLPAVVVRPDGPERAPMTLLLHGMGLGKWLWPRIQQRLATEGIPSAAIDLPGHGADTRNPSLEQAIDEVEAAARALPGCAIVGHSLGGYVAQVVAARISVPALVLVNAFPTAGVPFWPTRKQLLASWRYVPDALIGRRFHVRLKDYERSGLDALPEADRQAVFAQIGPWPGRMAQQLAFRPHRVTAEAIGGPILVTIGKRDQVVRWEVSRLLGERLEAVIWRYDDLGHFPMLQEEGRRWDDDLAKWLVAPRRRAGR